jgi:hypothetical protein
MVFKMMILLPVRMHPNFARVFSSTISSMIPAIVSVDALKILITVTPRRITRSPPP